MTNLSRVPPHDDDAERSVLGACLLFRDKIDEVSEILTPADFYTEAHGIIYTGITHLHAKAQPVDDITLRDLLVKFGKLDAVGGLQYISELSSAVPTGAHAAAHAQVVRNHARVREGIRVCLEGLGKGYDNPDPDEYLGELARLADEASTKRERSAIVSAGDAVSPTIARLTEQNKAGRDIIGIRSGFTDIDAKLSGLQDTDLIVIAGRPSIGKSALGINIAVNVALREELPVLVFSLEMSVEQIMKRVLGSQGNVPGSHMRSPVLLEERDWDSLANASRVFKAAPLYFDPSGDLTIYDIRARSRQAVRKLGIRMILIDYLQIITESSATASRDRQVAEITRVAKGTAKELGVPVILLSQLNRGVESRTDKRPLMADLRDSGAIEQDADAILMLYREAFYNAEADNTAEIIIRKNRNGPVGTVRLLWEEEYTRFVEPSPNWAPAETQGEYGI